MKKLKNTIVHVVLLTNTHTDSVTKRRLRIASLCLATAQDRLQLSAVLPMLSGRHRPLIRPRLRLNYQVITVIFQIFSKWKTFRNREERNFSSDSSWSFNLFNFSFSFLLFFSSFLIQWTPISFNIQTKINSTGRIKSKFCILFYFSILSFILFLWIERTNYSDDWNICLDNKLESKINFIHDFIL